MPGEKVTEGLDGLRERLREYFEMGARFAKWRAVIAIGEGRPSRACIDANAHALARYAALCQEAGLVPIVEPEVLMDGDHSMAALRGGDGDRACAPCSLHLVRSRRRARGDDPQAQHGSAGIGQSGAADRRGGRRGHALRVASRRSCRGSRRRFLSGGQSGELASARLNAMNAAPSPNASAPWALTFSYARAIQQPALEIWAGQDANVAEAQAALLHRARCNRAAREADIPPRRRRSAA